MKIEIPQLCLVVFIGPSGSGKSTFGRKHFKPTEVISSDCCRGLVSDDENDQAATGDAFDVLNFIAAKRLAAGKLTVIDATNVMAEDRKKLVSLARSHDCLAVAIVFDVPERLCYERNASRADRQFGEHVIRRQHGAMRRSLRGLEREGFRYVHVLSSEQSVSDAEIVRTRLWTDRRNEHGPFDIIGDVHGCYDELCQLLERLGYSVATDDGAPGKVSVSHPHGRRAIFVGDLVDRGPKTPQVLRLVMQMVADGTGLCVAGNHDVKLMKKLRGRDVRITHGLKESLEQLDGESDEFKKQAVKFLDGLIGHFVLDDGKLVVAHAGMKREFQGRSSARVREFGLYGETTGETDEYGLPVRYNWAQDYRGDAMVVYGHTPVVEAEWVNRTICIDTGCVFGGSLTALQYPERNLVSVKAAYTYYESVKPFLPEGGQSELLDRSSERDRELLDIDDVLGKRVITTRLDRKIGIREENAIAALEVMSRFAVNPKWLIYLPPTMSPCETSKQADLLEHPAEAFSYYLTMGVPVVVCEEKHMGSRAIAIVSKNEEVARKRFGVVSEGAGICYTRTGRRFFNDLTVEAEFIERLISAMTEANLWDELGTDWIALDCELMPWSAKAKELIRDQYAAVGAAASRSLGKVVAALGQTCQRELAAAQATLAHAGEAQPGEAQPGEAHAGKNAEHASAINASRLLERYSERLKLAESFRDAYRRYCWEVQSLDDIKLAPFQILATEGRTYFDRDHQWHMDTLSRLARADRKLLMATPYKAINLTQPENFEEGVSWWQKMTDAGGEGMVVKPFDIIVNGPKGIVQPAVKCRGREYLRIIYGPEYTLPEHLERLKSRALRAKRSLAIREFALGIESLERFVRHEPLYRVHECVFGVLALESEPVDPRL